MRPTLRACLLAGLTTALIAAGGATAANGGFTPPAPASPNASRIEDAYYLILAFTGVIFVLVEGALIFFIVRYRSRGRSRNVEGPQVRGNTRLEIAWTVVPVLILAAIASFVFYKLPGIKDVPKAQAGQEALNVRVEGHQYYWQYVYPDGQISIDRLVVPVGQVVTLDLTASDVVHSWWVPRLAGKTDAIPGRTNHTWFRVDRPGRFRLRCAELCGLEHSHMTGWVDVVARAEYKSFLAAHAPSSSTVGSEIVTGVCAKCHGLAGEGDIGPAIKGNSLIDDKEGLTALLRGGRGPTRTPYGMPAVGVTWSQDELDAAIAALQRSYGKGATGGG